ncbi:MAG: hypothetical protein QXW32_00675 [Nitrososphaerales archaeon]
MTPLDKLYWLRVAAGVAAGILATLLGFIGVNQPEAYRGVILALAVYALTSYAARYQIFKNLGVSLRKIYTHGLGSFIMLFLFTWILLNTLFFAA